jgi:hypothetical protein
LLLLMALAVCLSSGVWSEVESCVTVAFEK